MYTMTALRFSQDGDAALFSLQDMAFNADHCSMAYGKYKCKVGSDRSYRLDTPRDIATSVMVLGGKWMSDLKDFLKRWEKIT